MSMLRRTSLVVMLFRRNMVTAVELTATKVEPSLKAVNPLPALRHSSVITTIGSTPVIKLNRLAPESVNVYVKAEAFNPMGSVKDRLALGMIEYAEERGLLQPGQTVVEATCARGAQLTTPTPTTIHPRMARLPESICASPSAARETPASGWRWSVPLRATRSCASCRRPSRSSEGR